MKQTLYTLLLVTCITHFCHAQQLVLQQDYPGVTWPFLWDIEQDSAGKLYVGSELGTLFIKSNGTWASVDVDPGGNADLRGIAIDSGGVVWCSTEAGLHSYSNGTLEHFTTSNSNLPSDDLREIRAYDGKLWFLIPGEGFAVKDGNAYTHYTTANSDLNSDYLRDIEIAADGTVIIAEDEYVHFVKNGIWQNFDFFALFGFGTELTDIYIDHNQDIWFATDLGIIKFNHSNSTWENLKSVYGEKPYTAVIYTPEDKLWLGEIFKGLHYFDPIGNHYYFQGNLSGQPSQVFDFLYYDGMVRVIGNIGATVTGLSVIYPDSDLDGFTAEVDCNDTLASINPDASEIANNGIDENCDGEDLVSGTHELSGFPIKIYPNPASSILHIQAESTNPLNIRLSNAMGQLILVQEGTSSIELNGLSDGLYWLEVLDMNTHQKVVEKIRVGK